MGVDFDAPYPTCRLRRIVRQLEEHEVARLAGYDEGSRDLHSSGLIHFGRGGRWLATSK